MHFQEMDSSWRFNSVVKSFASDEQPFSTTDAFSKDQIGSTSCFEVKPSFINELPNEINIENQVFGDMGFPFLMRNSLLNPVMAASQNSFCESNSRVDLNFGRLIDQRDAHSFKPSKNVHNLSPSEVSTPLKRPREGGIGLSTSFCKVHGCNKNLSNCKEYHKRHKVCEVHSKTSKVIVNGIEQRFCQQCSRFHMLREFDEGKRSCRKRLAGHNERRRKPHVSERHGRLLPSYNINVEGTELKGSTGAILSFQTPNDFRSTYNGRWEMNFQDHMAHDLNSITSAKDKRVNSKSFSLCNFERNPVLDGIVNGYIGSSTSASSGLSGIASSSGSALSLLSCQSHTTCHSSIIQTSNSVQSHSHSMVFPGSHYESTQESIPLHDQHDMNLTMLGFEGNSVNYGTDEMFRVSKCINNSEDGGFQDKGCTIDLLQLSSQLERVEHQKRSSQVNDVYVGLSII